MNRKGFTLVELLATLVILGVVVGITFVTVNTNINETKKKTEDVFIKTIEDALNVYLDTDAKTESITSTFKCKIGDTEVNKCYIQKKFNDRVYLYKLTGKKFSAVISSSYATLTQNDLVNPANKDEAKYKCKVASNIPITLYRDDDYVYYYLIDKDAFDCLNQKDYITNLPFDAILYINSYSVSHSTYTPKMPNNKLPCWFIKEAKDVTAKIDDINDKSEEDKTQAEKDYVAKYGNISDFRDEYGRCNLV